MSIAASSLKLNAEDLPICRRGRAVAETKATHPLASSSTGSQAYAYCNGELFDRGVLDAETILSSKGRTGASLEGDAGPAEDSDRR